MKISLKWLNDFVEVQDFLNKPESLADVLTRAGLEVEAIDNKAKTFNNVVVGHILEKGKHPDADRLTLCQVSTGSGVVHQIVCGAKNHKQGDRVVVALPGAVLPGNFEIKKSKIRGVESSGMLCSEVELGLATESAGTEKSGIMILPEDAPIGKSFAEYQGYDDVVLDLKVTPNRSDCLSHLGLAREVSCLLNRPLKNLESYKIKTSGDTKVKVKLEVKNKDLCPRYTGCFIDNVKIGASPKWLKTRVESVGMKSINNVVDITNYVMMELGQPLHAFDYREIKKQQISVELSKSGDKFKTLDGTEIKLTGSELLIRDGERAVALAGVVGGLNSGIQTDTTQVFIEAAYFKADAVRKSSRKHGIETESAYRFMRGIDPENVLNAMNRCCQLIQDFASGQVFANPYDIYENKIEKKKIELSISYLNDRLGYNADPAKIVDWLKRIGCQVVEVKGMLEVTAPLYRPDLLIPEDLVEEFARLNGFEHIPEVIPATSATPTNHDTRFTLSQNVSQILREQGYQETVHYAFVDSKFQDEILGDTKKIVEAGLKIYDKPIKLLNPISEDLNVMRTSLAPGLLKTVFRNFNYGVENGRIFEAGFTFFEEGSQQFSEPWNLAMVAWGDELDLWNKAQSPLVFQLKTHVEGLIQGFGIKSWIWETEGSAPEFLHSGQWATLKIEGKKVGYLGTVHPKIRNSHKLRVDAAVAEFSLDKLLQGQPRISRVKPISRFPSIARDLSFVMSESLQAKSIVEEIQKVGKPVLTSVRVFDLFRGAPLQKDQKSLSFRLIYQDEKETLTDEKVAEIQGKIINTVSQKFGIQVR